MEAGRQVKRQVEQASRQAKPWVIALARFGYVAKGVVYAVIGVLATRLAFGAGGETTDSRGALSTILFQPFGKILLGAVAVGLAGYALWRVVQGVLDPEGKGRDLKGIAKRVAYVAAGLAYAGLALTAVQLVLGSSGSSSGNSEDLWTARLLAQPLGRWLVGIGGLVVIAIGLNALYVGFTAKFRKRLDLSQLSRSQETWAIRAGKVGLGARGVILGVIGTFLVKAAVEYDASEARSLEEALDALAQQPYGPWLLGAVGVGLIAYGAYAVVEARYRQIYLD